MSARPSSAAAKATDSVAGLRFLLVDDHKFSRHITIEALKWLNATKIDEAQDATEAISLLQGSAAKDRRSVTSSALAKRLELSDDRLFGQGKIDCVITDFNMAPLNGLHLLKAIRTGKALCERDLPVLMLTGFSDDHLISSALNLDVSAFVLKPISRVAFNEKLGRVLMRPITPQSIDDYESVFIPEADDLDDTLMNMNSTRNMDEQDLHKAQQEKKQSVGKMTKTVNLVDIATNAEDDNLVLGEDLVLAENVEGPNGNIILHRGTKLSNMLMEKLKELHQMGMMRGHIKILY